MHRLTERWGLIVAYALIVVVFALGLYDTRRVVDRQVCEERQDTYDLMFVYTEFLADQVDATPEQTAQVLADLREQVDGDRPNC